MPLRIPASWSTVTWLIAGYLRARSGRISAIVESSVSLPAATCSRIAVTVKVLVTLPMRPWSMIVAFAPPLTARP
jgi:hypothetical protein